MIGCSFPPFPSSPPRLASYLWSTFGFGSLPPPLQARLGTLVHQKNAAVICLTSVNKEDESKLSTLKSNFSAQFNDGFQRKWGGGIMGLKTQRKLEKRQKAIEAELAKKAQY